MKLYDVICGKMVEQIKTTEDGQKIAVDIDLSRVAKLQKIAFWMVYWMTSNIATVVSGAAEENRHAYITQRRANRFHPSSIWIWLGRRFE